MSGELVVAAGVGALGYFVYTKYFKAPFTPSVEATGTPAGGLVTPIVTAATANLPRGLRNNNPGNLKYNAANNWVGQRGKDKDGFVVFDTPQNGIRALAKVLKTYIIGHKWNTIRTIGPHWSPDATGLSGAYAKSVSDVAGIGLDTPLGIDANTLTHVARGIIAIENGQAYKDYYSPTIIAAGISAA